MHVTVFFRHPRPEYNSIEEVFETVLQSFPKDVTIDRLELPYSGASLKTIAGNLRFARRHRGQINHITGDIHYIALVTGRNTVLTVHDASSALQGSFLRKFVIKIFWFWLPALLVKKITTISPKSAVELSRIIPFARKKISVVPNPYNPRVIVNNHDGDNFIYHKSRLLLIGTKANKNLERTIEAVKELDVQLIVVGKLSPAQRDLLQRYNFDYENYFNIPFAAIASLYQKSSLVCFASTYEGFGMPIIEAQLAGRPVVTSAIEPLQWVAGEAACLVNPFDVDSIREGINRVLVDEPYRKEIIQKGKVNLTRFDPQFVAGMYKGVYEDLIC